MMASKVHLSIIERGFKIAGIYNRFEEKNKFVNLIYKPIKIFQ